jgi:hypothetical protein
MEALGGGEEYSSYSFTTSALHGVKWSVSRPGCALGPGKGPPVPIVQDAACAIQLIWTQKLEEKILSLQPAIEPRSPGRQTYNLPLTCLRVLHPNTTMSFSRDEKRHYSRLRRCYSCISIHPYTYTYTYTHAHAHAHARTHAHTHTVSLSLSLSLSQSLQLVNCCSSLTSSSCCNLRYLKYNVP